MNPALNLDFSTKAKYRIVVIVLSPCNPEVRLEKELRYLSKHAFDTHVIAWNRSGRLPEHETKWGAPLHRLQPALPNGFGEYPLWRQVLVKSVAMLRFSVAAFNLCRKLKPDVIYAHDLPTIGIGVLAKWVTRARLIYDAHEDYPMMLADCSKPLSFIAELMDRISAPFVDYVVTVDKHRAKKFSDVLKRKTIVAPNFPEAWFRNCSHIEPPGEVVPVINKLKELKSQGYFIVVSCTQFGLDNGLEEFVRSKAHMAEEKKVAYFIVGWGNYASALQRLADCLQLKNMFFTGRLSYESIPHVLHLADVGVDMKPPTPYMVTVFPTKVSEYLACGLPVIGGRIPEIIALAEQGCGIAVDSTQPSSIAEGILKLSHDKSYHGRLAAKASELGAALTWESSHEKFDKMFRELLVTAQPYRLGTDLFRSNR
ncbi:MAG: glycosyltransferase family 4 protein [Deltaproteobacteria bacterium]|nr:glycosyltransferase family 4 protein [Deltaproteobacteria bacterium]